MIELPLARTDSKVTATLLYVAAEYRLEGSVFEPRPDNLWMVSSSLWPHYRRLEPHWLRSLWSHYL